MMGAHSRTPDWLSIVDGDAKVSTVADDGLWMCRFAPSLLEPTSHRYWSNNCYGNPESNGRGCRKVASPGFGTNLATESSYTFYAQ